MATAGKGTRPGPHAVTVASSPSRMAFGSLGRELFSMVVSCPRPQEDEQSPPVISTAPLAGSEAPSQGTAELVDYKGDDSSTSREGNAVALPLPQ